MSDPFLGEIRMMSFNFAPSNWAFCDGQFLPIEQNKSLYSLLGTTYGGNGVVTFALPDLRGRTPLHFGNYAGVSYERGQRGGSETVTLITPEMAAHNHRGVGSSDVANDQRPTANFPATAEFKAYKITDQAKPMNIGTSETGKGQLHQNMQPYIAVNFCIALMGTFPSKV